MLKKLKDFFRGEASLENALQVDQTGEATTTDLQIATAVLLVEMASIDEEISLDECKAVVSTMCAHFGIEEEEVPEIISTAIASRKDQGRLAEFFECINEKFSEEQRVLVLAMVWKVVIADGKVEKTEKRFARLIQPRLKLDDSQAEEALRMAQHGKV